MRESVTLERMASVYREVGGGLVRAARAAGAVMEEDGSEDGSLDTIVLEAVVRRGRLEAERLVDIEDFFVAENAEERAEIRRALLLAGHFGRSALPVAVFSIQEICRRIDENPALGKGEDTWKVADAAVRLVQEAGLQILKWVEEVETPEASVEKEVAHV